MSEQTDYEDRKSLAHFLNSGKQPGEAAQALGRSRSWAYKWQGRYQQAGWSGLQACSRAPKHVPSQTRVEVRQSIFRLRSELEAERDNEDSLGYIGADAIYGRLRTSGLTPVPAVSTIERILRQAGKTKPRLPPAKKEVVYPHLKPTAGHQLTQVDIVPHYLSGGQSVACFNSIDVVSRYPAGRQYANKGSTQAFDFILHTWRELGISKYLQMDNESCFNGGYKHPGVIGKVVRLALYMGVEPVFSPYYHPESNAFVERFHQDYSAFVWEKTHLENLAAVHQRSASFFPNYRASHHHSALMGQSPLEIHRALPVRRLPLDLSLPGRLPITAGQIHFLRAVDQKRNVLILNKTWSAGKGVPDQGVWATLALKPTGAILRIYDAAPDAQKQICLAEHPFPLREPVVPLQSQFFQAQSDSNWWRALLSGLFRRPALNPSTMS
ncbi:MAG: integrase core domain-containing protein [Anaerolineae bacterium]|nr:integrase core domain-containing protein [Anaerolineae bacterium]